MKNGNKNGKKAFTLIELLLVIAIIGFLSTLIFLNAKSTRARARDSARAEDLFQIRNALELYYADHKEYPAMFSGPGPEYCVAISGAPDNWLSPFLTSLPKDPLGKYAYQYCQQYQSSGGNYNLQTYTLWTSFEVSPGNVNETLWPVGDYRPQEEYNYILSNWRP